MLQQQQVASLAETQAQKSSPPPQGMGRVLIFLICRFLAAEVPLPGAYLLRSTLAQQSTSSWSQLLGWQLSPNPCC